MIHEQWDDLDEYSEASHIEKVWNRLAERFPAYFDTYAGGLKPESVRLFAGATVVKGWS